MNLSTKTLLMLALPFAIASCENDDPISDSQVTSAEIQCTYTMSPEQLNYFDYTLRYTDDDGYNAYLNLDRPTFSLDLNSGTMPSERFFKFEISRKNTPAPSERVNWNQTFDVKIIRQYIDLHTDTITASNVVTYSPTPDEFEQWATSQYIPLMAQGYEIYINFAGVVNFSFD